MKLRFKFKKEGVLKYIGHLDLMRYFQKAFRRTDIEVVYTTGFSPHMVLSFAAPLGVGLESDAEYFDIEVKDGQDVSLMKDKLNATLQEGTEIVDVVELPEGAGNAMASVSAADYTVSFAEGNEGFVKALVDTYNTNKVIPLIKTTKTGDHELDIKESIFKISCDGSKLLIRVDASSAGNIKPKAVVEALNNLGNIKQEIPVFHIRRTEVYQTNKAGEFVSLISF